MDRSSRADVEHLRTSAKRMRRWIIEQSEASHVGHIGSALSIADIMVVLWEAIMDRAGTPDLDRDRFILCKGHASLALYSALRMRGLLSAEEYATYCADGSLLGVHPEHFLAGVDVSTGSLGQGLSIGCGLAFGLQKKQMSSRVFALVSDAECDEGQLWEAVMFAAHHRLSNLIATVDLNGLQAMGYTKDIVELSDMAGRLSAFGWDVIEVDGHDVEALLAAYRRPSDGRPRAVVAKTILGKGVSFMEDQVAWHYRNIDGDLAKRALDEIGAVE